MIKKLHLGSGKKRLTNYYNIDAIDYPSVDKVSDITDLSFVASNSIEEIYVCHAFEHLKRREVPLALKEWRRVLIKNDGILRISVPDFDACVRYYNDNGAHSIDLLQGLIFGGQTHNFNFHHACYNFESLSKLLNDHSFHKIERYDWRSFLPEGYDDYSRAYLPHMDFDNGMLMSLNITCISL